MTYSQILNKNIFKISIKNHSIKNGSLLSGKKPSNYLTFTLDIRYFIILYYIII